MADSWDSFEKLLRRVLEEAREQLAEQNPQAAWESYTQLLDLIRKAEVCASTEELQSYRIHTYQERALVRIQDPESSPESLEGAGSDLTMALKLSALSAAQGGRDDLLLLAQVYETRARFQLREGRAELALADLGRGIEALIEINPSDRTLEGRLIELYCTRIDLSRELGDTAGEWRDLGQMRSLLRTSIALGEGQNLRTLISVVNRRAELLQFMELSQPAMEEGRECLRLLSKLQQMCDPDEQQAVAQQIVELHIHLAMPHANRDWERESFDLVGHLCEAVELAAYQGAYNWISTELLREALEKAAPLCAAKLSLTTLRVFSLQDGAEAWGEILPAVLQRCNWDDLPHSLTTALFQRWRTWAFEPTGRWVGEAFRVLSGFPLRRLKESTEACQALRSCLEAWCDLPSHQLALLGVPQERLAAMAQDLAGVTPAPA